MIAICQQLWQYHELYICHHLKSFPWLLRYLPCLLQSHALAASFTDSVPVRNLLVSQDQIIVLPDHEVNAFPLHRCEKIQNCGDCVALQDPYCAWDLSERACVAHNQLKWSGLIQDLEHGYHEGCPLPEPGTVDNFYGNSVCNTLLNHSV